jgi:hypothetical protein
MKTLINYALVLLAGFCLPMLVQGQILQQDRSNASTWREMPISVRNSVNLSHCAPHKDFWYKAGGAITGVVAQIQNMSEYRIDAVKLVVWYEMDERNGRMFTTTRRSKEIVMYSAFQPYSTSEMEYGYFLRSLPLSARFVEAGVLAVYQKISP